MKKVIAVIAWICCSLAVSAQEAPAAGLQAAEISLPGIKGTRISLSSLKGKVVLIDFWASWCVPCRKTVPSLKKTYDKYKQKGFEIYGVSLDADAASWKQALLQDKTTWLHVIDTSGAIAGNWNINYIPHTYLLDKTGKIIAVNPTEKELAKHLQQLLP